MPLLVHEISPARKALLLKASFHAATPGIMLSESCLAYSSALAVSGELRITLSFLSTRLPPNAHKHQCTQVLASPVAWPSAMPPGVLLRLVALAYSRNASVVSGNLEKPAFVNAAMR